MGVDEGDARKIHSNIQYISIVVRGKENKMLILFNRSAGIFINFRLKKIRLCLLNCKDNTKRIETK